MKVLKFGFFSPEEVKLNPKNSALPDKVLNLPDDFSVGYLVIEK